MDRRTPIQNSRGGEKAESELTHAAQLPAALGASGCAGLSTAMMLRMLLRGSRDARCDGAAKDAA